MSEDILKKLAARVREEAAEPEAQGVAPFDAAAEDRIASLLLAAPETSKRAPTVDAPASSRAEKRGAVVRPIRWLYAAAAPLAAAAAFALWIATRPVGDAMPGYELALVSAGSHRAPTTATPDEITLDPDGDVEITARPATPARGAHARAVVVREGKAAPLGAPVTISDEGAVRVVGPANRVFPEVSGRYEVVIVIGSAALSDGEAERIALGAKARDFRVVRANVRFLEKK